MTDHTDKPGAIADEVVSICSAHQHRVADCPLCNVRIEPPRSLLAQLEYVREQIEVLAGMVSGAEALLSVEELDLAWHALNTLRTTRLEAITRAVYAVLLRKERAQTRGKQVTIEAEVREDWTIEQSIRTIVWPLVALALPPSRFSECERVTRHEGAVAALMRLMEPPVESDPIVECEQCWNETCVCDNEVVDVDPLRERYAKIPLTDEPPSTGVPIEEQIQLVESQAAATRRANL